ncbi:MAG: hypothetical protein H6671_13980 [Anaerolineaceae bacterium]|nr:hypothetical protein [Anaerolineaceae bacterium]
MFSRLQSSVSNVLHFLFAAPQLSVYEAGFVGLFFVQALRFLIGMLYSRVGSATLVLGFDPTSIRANTPGVVDPGIVSGEASLVLYMVALPLLALVIGRFRWFMLVSALVVAVGRALMAVGTVLTPTAAAAVVLGGGLLYIALLVRQRLGVLPYLFVLGFGLDQALRAFGNTLDPSWSLEYTTVQMILSVVLGGIAVLTFLSQRRRMSAMPLERGLMPFWGGIGLGGLLFLEVSLLALPNAIAGRARVDYTLFAPFVMLATLLPVVPWVRKQARTFITLFDGSVRGWSWMLLLALLFVVGTRFEGAGAGAALVVTQFIVSLTWWWLARPQAEKERNLTGLWVVFGVLIFLLLAVGDNFTYEYAYVRNFGQELNFLNRFVPPLLRGFRGMGLGLLLLSSFLVALPLIQTQRRIPWVGGKASGTIGGLVVTVVLTLYVSFAVRPPVINPVQNVDSIRVGTYNIHNGYSEFFGFDLEAIAQTIDISGAQVVLLQQVDVGRMTSFGVDESLWLARRLKMDRRFYATNEGLQGLAVLSKVPIAEAGGSLLTSISTQTGVQWVRILPDSGELTIYNTWLGFLLETGDGRPISEQEQDQQQQLTEIFRIISAQHPNVNRERILLGGTFNNTPNSDLIAQMTAANFIDPFAGSPLELSATLWRTDLIARVDYLWLRNPLSLCGNGWMDSPASDHRMIFSEVLLNSQAECPN